MSEVPLYLDHYQREMVPQESECVCVCVCVLSERVCVFVSECVCVCE